MIALMFLAMASASAMPASGGADHPETYLASVVDLPLGKDGALESFAFETWGVEFAAVCHIPPGWRITAGSSFSPNGDFAGEGSQGISWPRNKNPKDFRDLVLLKLYGPIQKTYIDGVPATFKGRAKVQTMDSDEGVQTALSYQNIRLVPAAKCPETGKRR